MPSNWISVSEAIELIVKTQIDRFGDVGASYRFAWDVLANALLDGSLPSRTDQPETFSLRFESKSESNDIALDVGSIIPPVFWHHFFEVQRSDGMLSAGQSDGSFWFVQEKGLRDGGILRGTADEVLIARSQVPGLRLRGRPPGRKYGDHDIVAEGVDAVIAGEDLTAVVKRLRDKMSGISQPASKGKRLRGRIREALNAEK